MLDQQRAGLVVDPLARRREPARDRRAVCTVERRQLLEREPIEVVLAQQVALAHRQRGERGAHGGLERLAVGVLEVRELGIVAARGQARDVVDQVAAGEPLARDPRRDRRDPALQLAAPRVVRDLGWGAGVADEQQRPHVLLDIVRELVRTAQLDQRRARDRERPGQQELDRPRIAVGGVQGEVEIRAVHAGERGLDRDVGVRADPCGEVAHEAIAVIGELRPLRARGRPQGLQALAHLRRHRLAGG